MVFKLEDVSERNNMQIQLIQHALLNMMKKVHDCCESNGIEYSLAYGSLLGAVRHKGFIPWDDDMDIFMTRDNFEKFLSCTSQLESLEVCSLQNTSKWPYSICKIIDPNTVCIEKINNYRCIVSGLFIDIFILDDGPKNKCIKKVVKQKIYFYSNLSQCVVAGGSESSRFRDFVIKIFSKIYTIDKINKKIDGILNRFHGNCSKIMLPIYTVARDVPEYNKDIINNVCAYKFEDTKLLGFKEYDPILKMFYSDYMKLPKVENRVQHSFLYLNLNYPYKKYILDHNLDPLDL